MVIANLRLGVDDMANFRGVKSAITEVTGGDIVILENVKFLQYRLVKVLYFVVLYCIALYFIALYCILLYGIILHCTALYCTVLYCTVYYCLAWLCIVLYFQE